MQWCGTETEAEDMNTIKKLESEKRQKDDKNAKNSEKNDENIFEDQPVYYKKKVFVLTSKGSVYFSEEEGKDFREMGEEFKKIGRKEGEANDSEVTIIKFFCFILFSFSVLANF